MRIIKFRAWNKQEKKMSEPFSLGHLLANYGDEFNYNRISKTDLYNWSQEFGEGGNVEVMQDTGLFDDHGQAIYEGDIVIDKYTKISHCQVIFKNGAFKYIGSPRGELTLSYLVKNEGTKVIGNIYENPELLKGQNDG